VESETRFAALEAKGAEAEERVPNYHGIPIEFGFGEAILTPPRDVPDSGLQ